MNKNMEVQDPRQLKPETDTSPENNTNTTSEELIERITTPLPEEVILSEHEITDRSYLKGGYNVTEIIQLGDDGSGVFKPASGEYEFEFDSKTIERGTYYKRERATYLIDRFLDLGLVPPTVIREIDGEIGSIQQFIPDADTLPKPLFDAKDNNEIIKKHEEQLKVLWIFDLIVYSSDRHGSNLIIDNQDQIHAIDNGLTLGNDTLRTLGSFYDQPLSNTLVEKLRTFLASTNVQKKLKELLGELLPEDEVDAFFIRLNLIAQVIVKQGMISSDQKEKVEKFN